MKAGNPSFVMDRPQQRMLTSEFWSLQRSSAIPLRGSFAEQWARPVHAAAQARLRQEEPAFQPVQ